ncbi:MAG TPA: 30S ribosomal protein S17 [Candidatus Kaiserbacteria bacterium]|nr:30S ribosomal protein S17 [Candidatus Kaiserbacteria bacterium]
MTDKQTEKNTKENKDAKDTKKVFSGVVVSNKMKDTIVVLVSRYTKHTKYKKFLKRTKKYMAHDKGNTKEIGDNVNIEETRPISKNKKFILK